MKYYAIKVIQIKGRTFNPGDLVPEAFMNSPMARKFTRARGSEKPAPVIPSLGLATSDSPDMMEPEEIVEEEEVEVEEIYSSETDTSKAPTGDEEVAGQGDSTNTGEETEEETEEEPADSPEDTPEKKEENKGGFFSGLGRRT